MKNNQIPLIDIRELTVSYITFNKKFQAMKQNVLSDINMTIFPGEILAIVGASGAGKSLLAHTLLGILPENFQVTGEICFNGDNVSIEKLIELRGKEIAFIPQTINALDPLMTVGKQVQKLLPKHIKKQRQKQLFSELQLPQSASKLYPFELSGGMARRVLIALALATDATFVIADEPTPGLHEESLYESVSMLKNLAKRGKGILFITHDLSIAVKIADRIGVMYGGELIEISHTKNFSERGDHLQHPYSKALWKSLPQNEFTALPGNDPQMDEDFRGCLFAARCPLKTSICQEKRPIPIVRNMEMVRCFHA